MYLFYRLDSFINSAFMLISHQYKLDWRNVIQMGRVEYKTVKAEEVRFGRNSFIEVARKIAVTEEGENEFVAISKGFYMPEVDSKRFRQSIALPKEPETLKEIAKMLTSI
jgi:hypothetical protein